jgi:purine-binding chemotaxis protein CheW
MENKDSNNSYLSFRLGEEIFAVHVSQIHKILDMIEVTEIPKAPDYMRGVINLRGSVLPVIDTRIKFGMSPIEQSKSTRILVMEIKMGGEIVMLGLLVDAVQSVLKFEAEDLLPPPKIGNQYQSEFILNMAMVKDKFYIILNMDAVFSSADHISLQDLAEVRETFTNEQLNVSE